MAQVHFQLSEGEAGFNPLMAASLCTLLLFLFGLLCQRLLGWLPLRMKAVVWFLPFLLLGELTHWRLPQFGDNGSASTWLALVLLLLLFTALLIMGRTFSDSSKENGTFATYAWPNALLLMVFVTMTVQLGNTDISLHRTLRSARHLSLQNYDKALLTARHENHPSSQLSAMTALALSETNQLGDCLFDYAQPHGSEGLLPQLADTALFYNLPLAVGQHLGYKRGPHISATFFLEVISHMPKATPAVRDYLLSAYLLDRNLPRFSATLLEGDSLSVALPRHYREALLLGQHLYPETQNILEDSLLNADFEEFRSLLNNDGTKAEREFQCRCRFGATYWCYYYFR